MRDFLIEIALAVVIGSATGAIARWLIC